MDPHSPRASRSRAGSLSGACAFHAAPQLLAASPVDERRSLGPYELCMHIGSGGMANVYLARDDRRTGIHRFVAVKCMRPHLAADPVYVEMFLDEAHIASQLRHPNVCQVFDYGAYDDEHFLAMEYLRGETLATLRSHERLVAGSPRAHALRLARLLVDVCEGLHAAHELCDLHGRPLEVVHRDVSPDNIFLTYEGVAKLVDFGTAKASCQRHQTDTGLLKGKLAYIQPEALSAEPLDRRADVWSVGVVAWELLTGQRLFKKDTDIATVRAVADLDVPPPSRIVAGLPPALDEVILQALRREPEERFATAVEMAQAIAEATAGLGAWPCSSELADWLHELFPHGLACRQQLLTLVAAAPASRGAGPRRARRRSKRVDESAYEGELTQAATTRVWATRRPSLSDADPTEHLVRLAATETSESVAPRAYPRGRRWRLAALAGAGLALAVTAGLPERTPARAAGELHVALEERFGASGLPAGLSHEASRAELHGGDSGYVVEVWSSRGPGRELLLRAPLDQPLPELGSQADDTESPHERRHTAEPPPPAPAPPPPAPAAPAPKPPPRREVQPFASGPRSDARAQP